MDLVKSYIVKILFVFCLFFQGCDSENGTPETDLNKGDSKEYSLEFEALSELEIEGADQVGAALVTGPPSKVSQLLKASKVDGMKLPKIRSFVLKSLLNASDWRAFGNQDDVVFLSSSVFVELISRCYPLVEMHEDGTSLTTILGQISEKYGPRD